MHVLKASSYIYPVSHSIGLAFILRIFIKYIILYIILDIATAAGYNCLYSYFTTWLAYSQQVNMYISSYLTSFLFIIRNFFFSKQA